jgi:hypothetical protein
VVEHLERALPDHLDSLARLAAGLAANAQRPASALRAGFARRVTRRLVKPLR